MPIGGTIGLPPIGILLPFAEAKEKNSWKAARWPVQVKKDPLTILPRS
jgi:hypothetical protein